MTDDNDNDEVRAKARKLVKDHIGPDHKVLDFAAFYASLVTALGEAQQRTSDRLKIAAWSVSAAYALFLPYWLWDFIDRTGEIARRGALDAARGIVDLTIAYAILMGLIWLFGRYPPSK